MIENLLIIVTVVLTAHYVFFILRIYSGLNKLEGSKAKSEIEEFVSVIIPFRNEENNIATTYNNLINQNYPPKKFEIIFVDDSSDDRSLEIISSLPKKENVKIISVPEQFSINAHKKRAIRFGIEKSTGSIIVTTDADCIHNENWLKTLLGNFDKETGFVSGPVEFISDGTFFGDIQKLEFAGLVITGAGLIGSGTPKICNAANIAYRREAFEYAGGFIHHMSLSSGDDELLMQKIHRDTTYKIKFALDKKCIVLTQVNPDLSSFYHQRKRWASKGLFYGDKLLIIKLILIFLFYLSLILQPLWGIIISIKFLCTFFISFLLKIITEYLVLRRGTEMLFEKKILRPFLITEILQVPYIIVSGFMGTFGNFTWKNRKIKR